MLFPASAIACADPVCPSCSGTVQADDCACVHCGYNFEFAAKLLPYVAPALRKFIDYDGYLSRDDIKRGQRALEKLRRHFPQVTLCTCVAVVPEGISCAEFGFWLFNQSVPKEQRMVERRLHSILLCIDPVNGASSLTVGYALDPFLDDAALASCLDKIRRPLAAQDYGNALRKLCRALLPELNDGFAHASRAYKELIQENRAGATQPQALPPVSIGSPPRSQATKKKTGRRSKFQDSHV